MIKKYQVTLYCNTKAYKPVSCIINYEQPTDDDLTLDATAKKQIQSKGVIKICNQRYWTKSDLIKYGYTRCRARVAPTTA